MYNKIYISSSIHKKYTREHTNIYPLTRRKNRKRTTKNTQKSNTPKERKIQKNICKTCRNSVRNEQVITSKHARESCG